MMTTVCAFHLCFAVANRAYTADSDEPASAPTNTADALEAAADGAVQDEGRDSDEDGFNTTTKEGRAALVEWALTYDDSPGGTKSHRYEWQTWGDGSLEQRKVRITRLRSLRV
jgi:hypothetical protein